jgi:serine/threonine-protein kinase
VFNGKLPDKIAATFSSTSHTAGQTAEDTAAAEDNRAAQIPPAPDTSLNPKKPGTDTTPVTQRTQVTKQEPITTQAVKKPEVVKKPPVQRSPSYPRPTSVQAYLNGMLNEEIPLEVRDQWKPAIRRYFTPDAIVYATMDGSPLGSFGVAEFMDILLSTENASINVENIIRDEEGDKIDELNVNLTTVEANIEQDTL